MDNIFLKKEELIALTYGDYSDYTTLAICRVLVNLDIVALKDEYLQERSISKLEEYEFLSWLIANGKVEQVVCKEIHLGNFRNGQLYEQDFGIYLGGTKKGASLNMPIHAEIVVGNIEEEGKGNENV